MTEDIRFSGRLTKAELRTSHLATYPRIFKFWPWLYLVAIGLVLVTANLKDYAAHLSEDYPGALLLLLIAAFLFAVPRLGARKALKNNPSLREPFSGHLSNWGFSWQGAFDQGEIPWDALYGYRSRGEILLVYIGLHQAFFLLPRFFATPEEWDAAEELVVKNLRPR